MDKLCSFRNVLEALSNCGYCSGRLTHPYVSLDRDHYQISAYLPEESFSSHFTCVQAAENMLHEYYMNTCSQFTAYCDSLSADGFLMQFKEQFVSRLSELKELAEACRAPDNAAEINAILDLLVPDEVFLHVEQIHEALNNRYALASEGSYIRLISYEKYDPAEYETNPAAKLAAKLFIRHGYDLLDVIHRLESDATNILRQYKNAFDAQAALEIERSIICPALSKLRNIDPKEYIDAQHSI